jgi:hypothetical protein
MEQSGGKENRSERLMIGENGLGDRVEVPDLPSLAGLKNRQVEQSDNEQTETDHDIDLKKGLIDP